jgi:hypothetical protein
VFVPFSLGEGQMTKLVGFLAHFCRARSGVSAAEYMLWLAIMVVVGTFVLS